jgi:plastocyanin
VRALILATVILAALPAGARAGALPSSGAFTAMDFEWDAAGGGHTVVIAQGGAVTFGYPSGRSEHNAHFTTGIPSSCVQNAGADSGAVPPLPHTATGAGWTGSCTFGKPGRYTFHCDAHPFMTGTVAVQAAGTSATSSPLTGRPGQAVRIAAKQRGATLRGTLKISPAGEGGSLQATLTAGKLGVGRTSTALHAGTVKLSVKLSRSGKDVLTRNGQLSVQVKLVIRTPAGQAVRVTRRVVLRR